MHSCLLQYMRQPHGHRRLLLLCAAGQQLWPPGCGCWQDSCRLWLVSWSCVESLVRCVVPLVWDQITGAAPSASAAHCAWGVGGTEPVAGAAGAVSIGTARRCHPGGGGGM